jgi:amino acid permease
MSAGTLVFIVGLYMVPLALLAWGHKIRKLSYRSRRAFWGAIIGHCVAGTLAVTWGMIPPENWTADEVMRGFFGLWAMLALPLIGAIGGALTARAKR